MYLPYLFYSNTFFGCNLSARLGSRILKIVLAIFTSKLHFGYAMSFKKIGAFSDLEREIKRNIALPNHFDNNYIFVSWFDDPC